MGLLARIANGIKLPNPITATIFSPRESQMTTLHLAMARFRWGALGQGFSAPASAGSESLREKRRTGNLVTYVPDREVDIPIYQSPRDSIDEDQENQHGFNNNNNNKKRNGPTCFSMATKEIH
jgi:hypothetical protein